MPEGPTDEQPEQRAPSPRSILAVAGLGQALVLFVSVPIVFYPAQGLLAPFAAHSHVLGVGFSATLETLGVDLSPAVVMVGLTIFWTLCITPGLVFLAVLARSGRATPDPYVDDWERENL